MQVLAKFDKIYLNRFPRFFVHGTVEFESNYDEHRN